MQKYLTIYLYVYKKHTLTFLFKIDVLVLYTVLREIGDCFIPKKQNCSVLAISTN